MKRSSLKGLDALVRRLDADLAAKDAVREKVIALSREMVRASAESIRELRERGRAGKGLSRARELASKLKKATAGFPELFASGTAENALQEVAIISGRPVPAPESFSCTASAFLLGLGDAIGELRRMSQDALRRGDLREAEEALHLMESLYTAINLFDYPDAIVPLKHKQDVARGLIEKTRGEVAVAVRGRDLERKIAALEKVLARHAPSRR
jgi:translin